MSNIPALPLHCQCSFPQGPTRVFHLLFSESFSRQLACILRHKAIQIGLTMREEGFVPISEVMPHVHGSEQKEPPGGEVADAQWAYGQVGPLRGWFPTGYCPGSLWQ
jgi:hypothetical protein